MYTLMRSSTEAKSCEAKCAKEYVHARARGWAAKRSYDRVKKYESGS